MQKEGLSNCWCGGQLRPSVHLFYAQCQDCGTLVLKKQPPEEQLQQFYSFDRYWHNYVVNTFGHPPIEQRAVDDFGDRIPAWYQLLRKCRPKLEKLLEIGCAHGGFLHYCHHRGVKNVVGIEPDERTCQFARRHFNLPDVISGMFPDVALPFEKFDAVVGFDVLEHFLRPLPAMRKVADLLEKDGICLFQIPCYRGQGQDWIQFKPQEHIFLFNSQSIQQLWERAGLEVTQILPGYFPDDVFVVGRQKLIRNLLFVRTDSIGDNVLAASMLPHIREKFRDAQITVVCQEHIAELYQYCPWADAIVAFNKKRALQSKQYRQEIIKRLQALKPQLSLNSVFSREPLTDLLAIGSCTGQRVAMTGNLSNIQAEFRDSHNQFYTKLLPSDGQHKSELDRHRDFLHGLGIDVPGLTPVVWTTAEDERFAEKFFKDNTLEPQQTIALFAGAQHQVRLYDKYGQALSGLCKKNQLKVVALGSEQEHDINQRNLDAIGVQTVNLSGKTTIRQSAALLKRCRLAVGAETGLAHIACAVATPNVILLGGGHFGRFMPYSPRTSIVCLPLDCFGCDWRCRYERPHCVRDVAPEVIAQAVQQSFEKTSEKPRVFVQIDSPAARPEHSLLCTLDKLLDTRVVEVIAVRRIPVAASSVAGRSTQASRQAGHDRGTIESDQSGDGKYLVSAIVSTYNSQRFIRGCLEDLENQTIADKLEIIVVDSGSQENEGAIVKEFQQNYDNIRYIRTEQRETVYAAWNRAVKVARGKFITNANTDDRHREDALEVMANMLLARPDIALVYADQIRTDNPNDSFANHHGRQMLRRADYSRQRLLWGCCVGSQPMWRKSLHKEFGYFDETLRCAGDWDFWLQVSSKYEFKHIPELLGLYYYNTQGLEHSRKIHSLYERYIVGKRYGTPYISVIPIYQDKNNPLVSVIMPAYNAQRYIAEALESVLIQNYRNFELIIVDDGSTDNTREIIAGFQNHKVRYFYQENTGAASARNRAIEKTSGTFIINLDADDMMTPDFISRHLIEFKKHPDADLIYCDDGLIDENDKLIRVIERPEYSDRNSLIRDMFRSGFTIVPFRTCVRRAVFDKIGFFDEGLLVAEDYDMMRRFIKEGLRIHHLKAALYLRRMTAQSLSRDFSDKKARCHFEVLKRFASTFAYEQLFPDVAWEKIAPERKPIYAKCLAAATYLAVGQSYIKSNSIVCARVAFDRAYSELSDCLKMDPNHQPARGLLQKLKLLSGRYNLTVAAGAPAANRCPGEQIESSG